MQSFCFVLSQNTTMLLLLLLLLLLHVYSAYSKKLLNGTLQNRMNIIHKSCKYKSQIRLHVK
jgi:hypothetical protein